MSRQQGNVNRREFLRGALRTAGALALPELLPAMTLAGQAGLPRFGSRLIGTLEGPELILEPARRPRRRGEAPMLAELVKAGRLPPVEKRLPDEPMVVNPLHAIGSYGGTWRRGFTGPGDGENGNRLVATDKLLFWDYTGTKIRPCVARGWRQSDDGRRTTIFLRKGMRWSDGHPFTAADFVFWFEDIYSNRELQPTTDPFFTVNGTPGRLFRRGDFTVVFEFPEPNYLFLDILAGSTTMGGGQAREQMMGRTMGAYMPAHYLKQFHPKYVPREELERRAKAAGFDTWTSFLKSRWDWRLNPELPVLGPWKSVSPITAPAWTLERNPYYYAIDSEGNQLPYIDRISMGLGENLEVINLRAVAGQYDLMERHTALSKLPAFLEGRARGNYEVYLDPAGNGGDAVLHTNQAYEGDPEIARWLLTRDFRRALSLGIDRDQLNETFWLGLGTPGSAAPAESSPESPGPEWRRKWSVLDLPQANALLDRIGLGKKDGEGYRLRTDGKGRLRLELSTVAGAFLNFTQIAEMIKGQWKRIGIQADIRELERTLFFARIAANEQQIAIFLNDGSEQLYLYPRYALPVDPIQCPLGEPIARWYASGGAQGQPPRDPELRRALEMFRAAPGTRAAARRTTAREIWKILVDNQYSIGTVGLSPAVMGVRIVSRRMGNVPRRQINAQHARTPGTSHPATFFFKP